VGVPLIRQFKGIQQKRKIYVDSNKTQVILFYTNWCMFSKQFFPVWESIRNMIYDSNLRNTVSFKQFDCDVNKELCMTNKITGYPSIVLKQPNGNIIHYPSNQQRSSELIVDFIKSNVK